MEPTIAADLSYLVVPPILVVLLFPLWNSEKRFLADQFRFQDLTWRLVRRAFAIGLLIRILWWSQLVAGISFGFYSTPDPDAIVGPVFSFQCASPELFFLGFTVMAVLIPLIEETAHRGFIQTALDRRSFTVAIITSSSVFTVFHNLDSWATVFLIGLVLGSQYRITRSLWSSVVTHATINGLIQIDWRCLSGLWNPMPADLPLQTPGLFAMAIFAWCFLALVLLLQQMAIEARISPR